MEQVTIALSDEQLEDLDRIARERYDGDREAAARALLDEWLARAD